MNKIGNILLEYTIPCIKDIILSYTTFQTIQEFLKTFTIIDCGDTFSLNDDWYWYNKQSYSCRTTNAVVINERCRDKIVDTNDIVSYYYKTPMFADFMDNIRIQTPIPIKSAKILVVDDFYYKNETIIEEDISNMVYPHVLPYLTIGTGYRLVITISKEYRDKYEENPPVIRCRYFNTTPSSRDVVIDKLTYKNFVLPNIQYSLEPNLVNKKGERLGDIEDYQTYNELSKALISRVGMKFEMFQYQIDELSVV